MQAGVANQYLFNPVFQPATFGVLLIVSVYLFLADHPHWAAASAAVAALSLDLSARGGHVDRGLHGAELVGNAPARTANRHRWPRASVGRARADLATGSCSSPRHRRPSPRPSPSSSTSGHPNIRCWTSGWTTRSTSRRIGGVGAVPGAACSRLFVIMLILFAFAVAATLLQVLASDAIAFLAPWRLVFPVPLATGVILAWAINAVWTRWGGVLAPRTMDRGRDGCCWPWSC
ncbi:MAG: hypothetical protein R3A10_01665 [Caldilineaceae bacterium]